MTLQTQSAQKDRVPCTRQGRTKKYRCKPAFSTNKAQINSWYGIAPKLRPTMQCHVGLYFLSNSFLTYDAMSFSILYRSSAYTKAPTLKFTSLESTLAARGDFRCLFARSRHRRMNCSTYLSSTVNSISLHVLGHVSIFNYRFPLGHCASETSERLKW